MGQTWGVANGRNDLGSCIRVWRGRLQPATAGLATNGTRRTTGLRREEVAALAGLSVDYLVRLEQGRASNPSAEVLASLSRALRLTTEERDHLFGLAGRAAPSPLVMPMQITPGVERLMQRLEATPMAVCSASWTMISWNPMWAALMGDPSGLGGRDRNIVWRHFTGAASRVVRTDEENVEFKRAMVADLRSATTRFPDDLSLSELIADLRHASDQFEAAWEERRVAAHRSDRKTIDHPVVGPLTLDCDILSTEGGDLRIIVYTADPASDDGEKLDLVRVIGLQDLVHHEP